MDGDESRHGTDEKFKKLFSYTCSEVVQGRPVNAMVWNTASTDLLAVGYGKTENFIDTFKAGEALNEEKHGGLVLFWSLRNPNYPEKNLKTMYPVTALDFSKLNPMVLAVGFSNGDVSIYDVRREGANWGIPVESSLNVQGLHGISGHSDPVWYCAFFFSFLFFIFLMLFFIQCCLLIIYLFSIDLLNSYVLHDFKKII